jgi:hypothetical protein
MVKVKIVSCLQTVKTIPRATATAGGLRKQQVRRPGPNLSQSQSSGCFCPCSDLGQAWGRNLCKKCPIPIRGPGKNLWDWELGIFALLALPQAGCRSSQVLQQKSEGTPVWPRSRVSGELCSLFFLFSCCFILKVGPSHTESQRNPALTGRTGKGLQEDEQYGASPREDRARTRGP